jgi:hypothetical protein
MTRNHPRCLTDVFVFQVKTELGVYRELNNSATSAYCTDRTTLRPRRPEPPALRSDAAPGD